MVQAGQCDVVQGNAKGVRNVLKIELCVMHDREAKRHLLFSIV